MRAGRPRRAPGFASSRPRGSGSPSRTWVTARSPTWRTRSPTRCTGPAVPACRSSVHYGVMIPGIAEPFRFLTNIVILGTARRVPAWNTAPLLNGEPAADSAWVMTGSAIQPEAFHRYSIEHECDFAADGSRLRFGDQLSIDGRPNGRSGAETIKVAVREA